MDYKAYRRKDDSVRQIIESIASIASNITEGFPLEFSGVGEDQDGLYTKFKTPDGELPFNCLSQGTQSIMQWLAFLLLGYAEYYDYPKDLRNRRGILIIDEIDAHLHPSWQQRIIPNLTEHFPNLQIFSSSHSPLMLAGLSTGQVHLMHRKGGGKVSVTRNQEDISGWSADEILRGLMDLRSPTDLATTRKIERLQELRERKRLSAEEKREFEKLRHEISEGLLSGPAVAQIETFKKALEGEKKK